MRWTIWTIPYGWWSKHSFRSSRTATIRPMPLQKSKPCWNKQGFIPSKDRADLPPPPLYLTVYHVLPRMSRKGVIKIEANGKKKMGRPTNDPKHHVARLRLSDTEKQKLDECCRLTGMSITDVLKLGIEKVYDEVCNHWKRRHLHRSKWTRYRHHQPPKGLYQYCNIFFRESQERKDLSEIYSILHNCGMLFLCVVTKIWKGIDFLSHRYYNIIVAQKVRWLNVAKNWTTQSGKPINSRSESENWCRDKRKAHQILPRQKKDTNWSSSWGHQAGHWRKEITETRRPKQEFPLPATDFSIKYIVPQIEIPVK